MDHHAHIGLGPVSARRYAIAQNRGRLAPYVAGAPPASATATPPCLSNSQPSADQLVRAMRHAVPPGRTARARAALSRRVANPVGSGSLDSAAVHSMLCPLAMPTGVAVLVFKRPRVRRDDRAGVPFPPRRRGCQPRGWRRGEGIRARGWRLTLRLRPRCSKRAGIHGATGCGTGWGRACPVAPSRGASMTRAAIHRAYSTAHSAISGPPRYAVPVPLCGNSRFQIGRFKIGRMDRRS